MRARTSNPWCGTWGGLHATEPATPYLSLFARMPDFLRDQLDEALYEKKSLGRIRCMRNTVYMLPLDLIPTAFTATRRLKADHAGRFCKLHDITPRQFEKAASLISGALAGGGLTVKQLREGVGDLPHLPSIVNLMSDQGILVRGRPAGGWRSNLHTYHLWGEWFPGLDPGSVDDEEALARLVGLYLSSFGPATVDDAAWWTGLPKGVVGRAAKTLAADGSIERLRFGEVDLLVSAGEGAEARRAGARLRKHIVNILPCLDPLLMGYRNRRRQVDPEHYGLVYDRSGNATSTILVDGTVSGVWDLEMRPGQPASCVFFLFVDPGEEVEKEVRSGLSRMGFFITGSEVEVDRRDSMTPLADRTAGGYKSPLRH